MILLSMVTWNGDTYIQIIDRKLYVFIKFTKKQIKRKKNYDGSLYKSIVKIHRTELHINKENFVFPRPLTKRHRNLLIHSF